jgi:hypothetical protein
MLNCRRIGNLLGWDALGSNLSPETDYSDKFVVVFFSYFKHVSG